MDQLRVHRRFRAGLSTVATVATILAVGIANPAIAAGQVVGSGGPDAIADSYLVVFDDHVTVDARANVAALTGRLTAKYDVDVEHTYEHAVHGFAGTMTRTTARRLAAEADVAYVEQNRVVRALDTQPSPPSWGLDRIDQRDLPLDDTYTYPDDGAGVTRLRHRHRHPHHPHRTSAAGPPPATTPSATATRRRLQRPRHARRGHHRRPNYGVAKGVTLVRGRVLDCTGTGTLARSSPASTG